VSTHKEEGQLAYACDLIKYIIREAIWHKVKIEYMVIYRCYYRYQLYKQCVVVQCVECVHVQ